MNLNNIQKYMGFFFMEYERVKLYVPDIIVRALIISLRIVLPYSVFAVLVATNQITGEMANSLVWAILVGQILNGASMRMHMKIREDIRSGNISIRLGEPVNYVWAKLFQSFGYFVPTFITYTIIFGTGCYLIFPTEINLPVLFFFSILSFLILNIVNIILGLTSFIIEENDGIYWLTSKMFFIFGNQIVPVALMPAAVITFAQFTPFYLGLAGPIEAASGRLGIIQGLIVSVFYIVVLSGIAQFMLKKLEKRLILNG